MRYLHRYVQKHWKWFTVAISILTIEALVDLLQPTIMANIIDHGVAQRDMDTVLRMGGIMLLITAIGAVSALVRNIISSRVSQQFGTELRSDLYRKIQSLSFERIDQFERASLITRLTNDVTQVQNFSNGLMRIFVRAPLLGLGSLIMAFRLNPHLFVVPAVVVPIAAILVILNMRVGFPRFMKVQAALDRVNKVIREYLSGVRVVKAFNRFDYEVEKFHQANTEYQTRSIHVMRAMAIFNPAIMLAVNLGIIAIIWIGAIRVDNGSMEVGHIVAFVNYMTQLLFSLMLTSMVFTMFVRAKASASRIGEVFALNKSQEWLEQVDEDPLHRGRIDFEQVSFSYNKTATVPVLKQITFTCLPGETVGIIGSTGSGKSSLVGLIPRFYDADEGVVKVNGIDVKKVHPEKLRESIAVVPQKTVLFTGTIIDNIRWGKSDATREEVERVASIAGAHEFISAFPEGYDTKLGQQGVNLSGGQKQRISIARALIRKPDILILDDCTSAVDVATEAKIKKALKAHAQDLTCLIITQRISSVMDADRIIVLDKGEIVGMGSHEILMRECEVYQEIARSQTGVEVKVNE